MTRKVIVAAAIVTTLGLGAIGINNASAQSTADGQNPMSSLVKKIATKFNLNETEVQAVFDEAKDEHRAEMKANYESQLSQYVKDGKITEAQKQLIISKMSELEASRGEIKDKIQNLTPEEMKTQMETKKTELEAWAKENGIDLQYLMPRGMKGHGEFRGEFGGREFKVKLMTPSPTTTQ